MRSGATRLVAPALAMVSIILLGATGPQSPIVAPDAHLFAPSGTEGSAGGLGGGLGLLLLAGLALAVIVAATAAAVILYRTRASKVSRIPAEGWWTCSKCGAGNMDGTARCHACSTWRTSVPHPTTTT